ncbi:DNA mismatch repair endonuclease MutL [Ammoniphilus resinae]|uniref:DNA mismatch repair protein MutL n=1 Tax=Ammoniphilus resinae TaxID=861532 RepID=A0ABS4GMS9_9BACL|nr:DNA mismatch repair endonuclease MutL [Ammoniphilus resinae]MBP1931583.1 DNA mismatch repair protein MutL [Ammoniphilus resinae]
MGIIQILDDRLANLIAAGEVVERPASVVKELVENAIDAGSSQIEVHIEEGGLRLIRVVDNGIGMTADDCEMAFERHATSKIRQDRDLFQIRTLGFRGEALPSIASVSKVDLSSCTGNGIPGLKMSFDGGKKLDKQTVALPKGTEIHVKDLFFNTPARLKYLKSMNTEVGHVADYMNRLALSYPDISFLFTSEGKTLLKTYGDGQLLHVIASVYGTSIAKEMLLLEAEDLDFKVYGYIGNPQITRANRGYLSTLINGRYVKSHSLNGAVLRGYHTLLPINRYPIVVLQFEMEPSLLDVNVHPAKLEVKFSKEQELLQLVETAVRDRLRQQRLIPEPARPQPKVNTVQTRMEWGYSRPTQQPFTPTNSNVLTTNWEVREREDISIPQVDYKEVKEMEAPIPPDANEGVEQDQPVNAHEETKSKTSENQVPLFYPLAQLHGTYILAQSEDGLFIIDQHAAQERIFYEYFLGKLSDETIELQELLIPISIELPVQETKQIQDKLSLFQQIGLELEPFGLHTFRIRSHPRWFVAGEEEAIIHEMVDMVIRGEQKIDTVKIREKAAIMMSCKAAIKANRHLNHLEMEALLNKLRETTSPYTCPHGRPIIIHFSTYDIEKMFKRVM